MKKYILFIFAVFIVTSTISLATTRTITVQNFSFSPSNINANVGDTIKWVWVSGSHTTTSTIIPSLAAVWDANLNSGSTTFIYKILIAGTYNYKCTPHESMGMTGVINASPSAITQIETVIPKFELKQNYPNPFNPTTNINFGIAQKNFVTLKVYDLLGNEVQTLVSSELNAGSYNVDFNATELSSGVYFYKLQAGKFNNTRRMIIIK